MWRKLSVPHLNEITVCSRSSNLAKVQVKEVWQELLTYHPLVKFHVHYFQSRGDLDLLTSLRNLGKSDFFTKELDELVLKGSYRIAIHSAKDLPDPLPKGLDVACFTKGIDSSDSLVLKEGSFFEDLPRHALIATSSVKREQAVLALRSDLTFCDLRGTIEQRLAKLGEGKVDGVVIAEAALIRLGLTHLNRIRLPHSTTEGQGKLCVIARQEDWEIKELFQPMHYPFICHTHAS